jgi:hypothetical protein
MKILNHHDENKLQDCISDRSAFGSRDKAMIDLFLSTGLRVAEMVGLRVEHVCGTKPGGGGRMVRHILALPAELAKGGRERVVPLCMQARQAVIEILSFNHRRGFSVAAGAPLFPNRKHQAMSTRAVRRALSGYCVQGDLDQAVTPHDLRHTWYQIVLSCRIPPKYFPSFTTKPWRGSQVRSMRWEEWSGPRALSLACHQPLFGACPRFPRPPRWEGWSGPRAISPCLPPASVRGLSTLSTASRLKDPVLVYLPAASPPLPGYRLPYQWWSGPPLVPVPNLVF